MAYAAADRPPVADRPVGNIGGKGSQRAPGHVRHASILDVRMGNAGADPQRLRRLRKLLELGNPGKVDQQIELREPQVEHRPERLAAGDEFRREIIARGEDDRASDVGGASILELCGLHAALRLAADAIASRIRAGVMGEHVSSAPKGRNASLTALTIAAGGAIAPPSPRPFTPNSVYGERVSMWSSRGAGTSAAPGRR